MPDQTPDQLREHAAEIMLDHARHVEWVDIRRQLAEYDIDPDSNPGHVTAIMDLISTATITIAWPDSPVQAMDVGADDQLATVTRERDEALQDVQSLTDDLSAVRTERDQIDAELATERREHGITDTALRQAIAELRETALYPDERQTAVNFLTAYIRLCGSRLPNDHAVHALVAKLSGPAPVPGSSRPAQDEPPERLTAAKIRAAIRAGLDAYPNSLSEGMDAAAVAVARLLDQDAAGESQASEPTDDEVAAEIDSAEEAAEAEAQAHAQGYAEAVARLRDDSRYRNWWTAKPGAHMPYIVYWNGPGRQHLADYLETVGPDGLDVETGIGVRGAGRDLLDALRSVPLPFEANRAAYRLRRAIDPAGGSQASEPADPDPYIPAPVAPAAGTVVITGATPQANYYGAYVAAMERCQRLHGGFGGMTS